MKVLLFLIFISTNISFAKISKPEVKQIFKRLESLFDSEFKKRGLKISFKIKKDNNINAEATTDAKDPSKKLVYIYQGYLNHKCQTYDSVLVAICHELGHHLSNKNKKTSPGHRRYSMEGEADYFAAKVCLPKYYKKYPNDDIIHLNKSDDDTSELCADSDDYNTCVRTLTASYNKIFCGYKFDRRFKYISEPSFKTPDNSRLFETLENHSSPQCRLDTYLSVIFS